MIRTVSTLFFFIFASGAVAEPVRVLSGEHGSFTRLIFEFETLPRWQLDRQGIGYRLSLQNTSPLSFDLSRVFRSIDRARLRDIRPVGNNTVDIELACDCEIKPSETGAQTLVLDIEAVVAQPNSPQTAVDALQYAPLIEQPPKTPKPDTSDRPTPLFPVVPEIVTPSADVLKGYTLDLEALQDLGSSESAAVTLMARALARAAAQGLVTANRESEAAIQLPQSPTQLPLSSRGNLSVSTGFDNSLPSDAAAISPPGEGSVCISDKRVDVASWGDTTDSKNLGRLRTAVIAEDGSVEPKGAVRLAKYYLHLGFGAEAGVSIQNTPPFKDREIIEAIADIMDRGHTGSDVFGGQIACDGIVSLWAALARPIEATLIPESTNALLSSFSALPSHLRSHLGPLLSERLHGVGLPERARSAINAVTRGGIRTDESELASARLELDGNDAEEARDILSELSNGTNATAAAALLELLVDAESRGMPPNPIWVEDVPTLVGALEGIEIAERLNIAGLKGLIALGRYGEFRKKLSGDSPGVTDQARFDLAMRAMEHVLKNGEDLDFITNELALFRIVGDSAHPKPIRIAFAERLQALGLSSRALLYLQDVPEALDELEIRVRALLATNQLPEALDMVANSRIEGASAFVGDVLLSMGKDESAIDAFLDADRRSDAHAAALRSGDWGWMLNNGTDDVATAVQSLNTASEIDAVADAPNGALIEETRRRREQLRDLLSLTQPSQTSSEFTN